MLAVVLLGVSILFQVAAACLAWRLIGPSGGRRAWLLITIAFVLRAIHLIYQLYLYLNPAIPYPLIVLDELISLVISALLAIGLYSIAPLFLAFRRAAQERELYFHSVSHDLRSPLTVIQGYGELLRERLRPLPLDQESGEALHAILQASSRMAGLVGDLTEIARLAGEQLTLDLQRVELEAYLNDLLKTAFSPAERQRIRLGIPPDLPPLAADPERLARVLVNLLTNALKYAPAETPIELQARGTAQEAILSVHDQGPGIPAADLARIFDRFYRAAGRSPGGLGLGLYVARILVEAHGGRIWADSAPGRGSTFSFTLLTWT